MEWIEGVKLTDKVKMAQNGLSVVDFVNVGIECTLRQLLDKGYFHAGALHLLLNFSGLPRSPRPTVVTTSQTTMLRFV